MVPPTHLYNVKQCFANSVLYLPHDEAAMSMSGIRRQGGGRKSALSTIVGLETVFLQVLAQHTAGSPMDETVKWTNLTRQEIAPLFPAAIANVNSARHNGRLCLCPARRRGSSRPAKALIISIPDTVLDA